MKLKERKDRTNKQLEKYAFIIIDLSHKEAYFVKKNEAKYLSNKALDCLIDIVFKNYLVVSSVFSSYF